MLKYDISNICKLDKGWSRPKCSSQDLSCWSTKTK